MFSIKAVECFPYRTTRPVQTLITLPRDVLQGLEHVLAKKSGQRPDNHTGYLVKFDYPFYSGERKLFFAFSDSNVRISKEYEVVNW